MRIGRALVGDTIWLVRHEGDELVLLRAESSHPARDALREALAAGDDLTADGPRIPVGNAMLSSPVLNPSKILCVGLNYADHAKETGAQIPAEPILFAKLSNSIIDPTGTITYAASTTRQLDYEAELAVVIGRPGKAIPESDALSHVLGYTVFNDVSARDAQLADGQWTRGKSYDAFAPIGPVIVTADEIANPQGLSLRCSVNGNVLQSGNTEDMIFTVSYLIGYISRFMSLYPGDVIATGTPAGIGLMRDPQVFLQDGDLLVTEIDGIGTLNNRIRCT